MCFLTGMVTVGEEIGYYIIIFKFLSFHLKPCFVYKMLSRTSVYGETTTKAFIYYPSFLINTFLIFIQLNVNIINYG